MWTAPYAIAYLVFNTINNLTTQDEQVACFRNVAAHLEPGGCFVIEVGIPALQRLPPGETVRPFTVTPSISASTNTTSPPRVSSPITTGASAERSKRSRCRSATCGRPSSTSWRDSPGYDCASVGAIGTAHRSPVTARPTSPFGRRIGSAQTASAARTRSTSVMRARATRERIVPIGTPHTSAVSAYGEPVQLGEHERGALVVVELGEQRIDHGTRRGIRGDDLRASGGRVPAPGADIPAHRVGTRAPGDGEQPGTGARVAAEPGSARTIRTNVSCVRSSASARPTRRRAVAPHVRLSTAYDRRNASRSPCWAASRSARQLVHPARKGSQFVVTHPGRDGTRYRVRATIATWIACARADPPLGVPRR